MTPCLQGPGAGVNDLLGGARPLLTIDRAEAADRRGKPATRFHRLDTSHATGRADHAELLSRRSVTAWATTSARRHAAAVVEKMARVSARR